MRPPPPSTAPHSQSTESAVLPLLAFFVLEKFVLFAQCCDWQCEWHCPPPPWLARFVISPRCLRRIPGSSEPPSKQEVGGGGGFIGDIPRLLHTSWRHRSDGLTVGPRPHRDIPNGQHMPQATSWTPFPSCRQRCIGMGGGVIPPRPFRAPSLLPATVPLTLNASLNGICNRQ